MQKSVRHVGLAKVASLATVVLLWHITVATGVLANSAVASPAQVAHALGELVFAAEFWSAIAETLTTWALGLTLSVILAVPIGLALGANDVIYRSSRFTIDFFRTIPPVALVPLLLLLFGATGQMVVTLIVIAAVWPLLLQSMYGVHQVDSVARDVARSYRLRWSDRVLRLILPSAAPFIATGVRIAATMSLLMAVGAELIASAPGLGDSIGAAQSNGDLPGMYAYLFVVAVLGVLVNRAMGYAERRLLSWHSSQRLGVAR